MTSDLTNYVSYLDPAESRPRIGHLHLERDVIQQLYFKSGSPITDLYQVIEAGEENITADEEDEPIPASSVKILPPISGRDILAVGKNYYDHAKEFNRSGFDSSDKVDVPSHPVIFTKRATSIVANGAEIYHHPEFTQSLDYEGEIGVIIGKAGYRVKEEDALNYVWGYTIINDVTARERQRDHKQFFIGKSGDTFCPMGPIAKPATHLPSVLRLQTTVNGQLQQDATTNDLIFSIPFLIKTLSEGLTLQPGDVIATGTPAGVGIGKTPPVYLSPGDTISIRVTGLSTLTNTVAATPPAPQPSAGPSPSPLRCSTLLGAPSNPPLLLLPHPGASPTTYRPLLAALDLPASHHVHLLSYPRAPMHPLAGPLDVPELLAAYLRASGVRGAVLVAHGLGARDVGALATAAAAAGGAGVLKGIFVIAPVATPVSEERRAVLRRRAKVVARRDVGAVVDEVVEEEVGGKAGVLGEVGVRLALEGEGSGDVYVRWLMGLAEVGKEEKVGDGVEVRAVIGGEDNWAAKDGFKELKVLEGVGRWPVFEDVQGLAAAVRAWL